MVSQPQLQQHQLHLPTFYCNVKVCSVICCNHNLEPQFKPCDLWYDTISKFHLYASNGPPFAKLAFHILCPNSSLSSPRRTISPATNTHLLWPRTSRCPLIHISLISRILDNSNNFSSLGMFNNNDDNNK
ncbi:hypothetical protein QL285_021368 [Trifolium repens]|nr:hypothetical protein QL285_021368 [Trifolium repens]